MTVCSGCQACLLVFVVAVHGLVQAQVSTHNAYEKASRDDIEAARQTQAQTFDERARRCEDAFAVTQCLIRVRSDKLAAQTVLDRRERQLNDLERLRRAQEQLERVRADYDLSTGYVYGLLQLIDLASDKTNPEHAMWRSRFAYRTRRYVVDKLNPEIRPAAQKDLAEQLGEKGIAQLGSRFRIPLFNHFYRQR